MIMDEKRKRAYRYLLYQAMLEIRILQWQVYSPLRLLNPFHAWRVIKRVRRSGALADLLHNMALFSALDFEHFKEDYFWEEYERFCRKYGTGDDYFNSRRTFDSELERQEQTVAKIN
jgi:hypothetical protein